MEIIELEYTLPKLLLKGLSSKDGRTEIVNPNTNLQNVLNPNNRKTRD